MADYVEKNLRKNEEVILRAKISWLTLVPWIIFCAVLEVGMWFLKSKLDLDHDFGNKEFIINVLKVVEIYVHILAFFPLVLKLLLNATTKLAVTNKRVLGKKGILSIKAIDYPIEKIDNISYSAGLFGNLFKYYTIIITGTSGNTIKVPAISNAQAFKNNVTDALEKHAEEERKALAEQIAAGGNKA